jgi:hypothetical protein
MPQQRRAGRRFSFYHVRPLVGLEQNRRARPSPHKTAKPTDARIQAIRDGDRDDPRNELVEKNKKNQFNLIPLTDKIETAPDLWSAVLAA